MHRELRRDVGRRPHWLALRTALGGTLPEAAAEDVARPAVEYRGVECVAIVRPLFAAVFTLEDRPLADGLRVGRSQYGRPNIGAAGSGLNFRQLQSARVQAHQAGVVRVLVIVAGGLALLLASVAVAQTGAWPVVE